MSGFVESGIGASLLAKFGMMKAITLGAAGLGAGLMAIFRPPKTRKEMFTQAIVALGSSLLFGNTIALGLLHIFPFIDITMFSDYVQYQVSVHGLLGALCWGIFGGFAHFRDKLGEKSIDETWKEVKDNVA